MEENKIFISYARQDYYDENGLVIPDNIVMSIEQVLEKNNYKYWIDRNINGGSNWIEDIITAIKQCKIFILVLTENACNSHFVIRELDKALELNKKIIPIKAVSEIPEKIGFLVTSHIEYIDYIGSSSKSSAITKLVNSINLIFDDSLKKLEDLLEASKKERNELDQQIDKYRKFQERLQSEIEVKKKDQVQLENEISLREESLELIKKKEKETEDKKDTIVLEIDKLQKQIDSLLTSKANNINTNSENTDLTSVDTPPTISDSDVGDFKDSTTSSKPVINRERNPEPEEITVEQAPNALEENTETPKPDFSKGAQTIMMGYFKEIAKE